MAAMALRSTAHRFSSVPNSIIPTAMQGISFANVETVRTKANEVLGYMGVFSWGVPALSWGLIKGGEYALSHAVGEASQGHGGRQTAQAVGADVRGSANVSLGNQTLGNRSLMGGTMVGSQASGAAGATWGLFENQSKMQALQELEKLYGGSARLTAAEAKSQTFGKAQQIESAEMTTQVLGGSAGEAGARLGGAKGLGAATDVKQTELLSAQFGGAGQYVEQAAFGGAWGKAATIEAAQFESRFTSAQEKGYAAATETATKVGGASAFPSFRDAVRFGAEKQQVGMEETFGRYTALEAMGPQRFQESVRAKDFERGGRYENIKRMGQALGEVSGDEDVKGVERFYGAVTSDVGFGVQTKGQAVALSRMTGQPYEVGDRVKAVVGEDGRIGAVRGDAGAYRENRLGSMTDAASYYRGPLNTPAGHQFIEDLGRQGYENVVRGLAQTIKPGQVPFVSVAYDNQGGILSFDIKTGGEASKTDFSYAKEGREAQTLDKRTVDTTTTVRSGTDVQGLNIETSVTKEGPSYEAGRAGLERAIVGGDVGALQPYRGRFEGRAVTAEDRAFVAQSAAVVQEYRSAQRTTENQFTVAHSEKLGISAAGSGIGVSSQGQAISTEAEGVNKLNVEMQERFTQIKEGSENAETKMKEWAGYVHGKYEEAKAQSTATGPGEAVRATGSGIKSAVDAAGKALDSALGGTQPPIDAENPMSYWINRQEENH